MTFDFGRFPTKNNQNRAKSNRIVPGIARRDRALILDSPMPKFFHENYLFFSISAIFRKNWGVKDGPKVQIVGISRFRKNLNFSEIYKHTFSLLEYYFWLKFHQNRAIFGGVRTQKAPKKGHSTDAESVWKTLKIYNLTTADAILMKLTRIIYLYDTFNLVNNWGVIQRV